MKRASMLGVALLCAALSAASVVYAATSKPDFGIAVSAASQSVMQGQSTSTTVTVSGSGGFAGSVALSASGAPSGATAALQPASVTLSGGTTSATSTLSVTTSSSTPAGTYSVTINGVSGTIKHSVSVTLTVNYALNGSFTVSAAPSAGTVTPGGYAATVVTLSRTGGFTGSVALATYGTLPAGVTSSFSPTVLPNGTTSSTLQLNTSTSTPTGTSTIYLVGTYTDPTGQKAYQYAQTTLTVTTGGKPFTISGDLSGGGLSPGTSLPLNLSLTNPNPQTLTLTNLTIVVSSTSAGSACAPSNFAVTQFTKYPVTLPSNASITLSQAGIAQGDLPRIGMVDLPQNQDACRGVGLNLAYSGTAQGN